MDAELPPKFSSTRSIASGNRTTSWSMWSQKDTTKKGSLSTWSRTRVSIRTAYESSLTLGFPQIIFWPSQLICILSISIDTTPNVDYFTREELREVVRKFKDAQANGGLDEVSSIAILWLVFSISSHATPSWILALQGCLMRLSRERGQPLSWEEETPRWLRIQNWVEIWVPNALSRASTSTSHPNWEAM